MQNKNALRDLLLNLSNKSIQIASDYYKTEAFFLNVLYIKPVVTRFEYKEGAITTLQVSENKVMKPQWYVGDKNYFIEKKIKCLPEYTWCVTEISNAYSLPPEQIDTFLFSFIGVLAEEQMNPAVSPTSKVSVEDYIDVFISDLENSPIDVSVRLWVNGVWPEDEECQLGGAKLRQTKQVDIEKEEPIIPFYRKSGPPHKSPSIVEFTLSAEEPGEVQREVESFLDVLRLFRLGSVVATITEMTSKSIMRLSNIQIFSEPKAGYYKYKFQATDVDAFSHFITKMKPLLPTPFENIRDYRDIAFQRYKEALLERKLIEDRITSVISCLEALYSTNNTEITHKLAQRVSGILRNAGFKPLDIFEDVKEAYRIRSAFIHGLDESKRKADHSQLCERIMEYARVSILIFYQLKEKKSKIIMKLDNSLLDEEIYNDFKESISQCVISR